MNRCRALRSLLLCAALAAAVADQRLRTQWLQHVLEVKSFACREPKRVSIAAADLAAEVDEGFQNSALVWQPACSAVHRCAGAGCCAGAPRRVCAAADADYVKLVFYVKNALEPQLPAFFRELSVLNHTACACRDVVDLPKR